MITYVSFELTLITTDSKTMSSNTIRLKIFIYDLAHCDKLAFSKQPSEELQDTVFLVRVETQDFQKLMLWQAIGNGHARKPRNRVFNHWDIDEFLLGVYLSILPRLVV